LKILGLWPDDKLSRRQKFLADLRAIIIFTTMLCAAVIPGILALLRVWGDMVAMADNMQIGLPFSVTVLKFIIMWFHKKGKSFFLHQLPFYSVIFYLFLEASIRSIIYFYIFQRSWTGHKYDRKRLAQGKNSARTRHYDKTSENCKNNGHVRMYHDDLSVHYSHHSSLLWIYYKIFDESDRPGKTHAGANILFARHNGDPIIRNCDLRPSYIDLNGRDFLYGHRYFFVFACVSHMCPNGNSQRAISQFEQLQRLRYRIILQYQGSSSSH